MRAFLPFFLLLLPFFASAQLTGTVRDENGDPLAFASVYVRHSSTGTVANSEGHYRLPLEQGDYEVVYQYLGYQQRIERVSIRNAPVRLDVRMKPSNLELGEVVITTEDPAVRMMREVIAKRRYYKAKVTNYSADVYIKGFVKLLDAPKKVLGQEIGTMGGVLDTNQQGVLYLSESVSKMYVQGSHKKEVMISSKVSGSTNGFSINRSTLTEMDLYDERLNIERDILSPLADNAFSYYTFKFMGRYRDENGFDICKIQVIPKRSADPVFSGYLLVVDDQWNLAGADLSITGATIKQPILDTLHIRQEFIPIQKPDTWCVFSQLTDYQFKLMGFKFTGFFNGISSNYDLNPRFEPGLFNRELFRVDKIANTRDSLYWAAVRPIPLTEEESRDYIRKDSLQKIWTSAAYLDSIDRKDNKFKPMNLIGGYTWRNSRKRISVGYPGALNWVQFNTVQGWLLNVNPQFTYYDDPDNQSRIRYWKVEGNVNYGFSETTLRGALQLRRRFEGIHYKTGEISGGSSTEQFNSRSPISPLLNDLYSLYAKRNYLKIYDKRFVQAAWEQYLIPGLWMRTQAEWAQRNPLVNHSNFSWNKKSNRAYTPNTPLTEGTEPAFSTNEIFSLSLTARISIGQQYETYPTYRTYQASAWPELLLHFRTAVPGVLGSDAHFNYVEAQIKKSNISMGLAGYSSLHLVGGGFLTSERVEFMDLRHAQGNQTCFGSPRQYIRSFFLLPYYDFSTSRPFFEAHWEHHLQGWLLDKIPGIRRLHLKEVFGAKIYYADQTVSDAFRPERLPYWEAHVGLENLGISFFRGLRVDVAAGFFGTDHYRTGLMVGMDF